MASGRCKVEEAPKAAAKANEISKAMLIRLFGIILFTTAIGGLVFQSTTFALPKIFDERLAEMAGSATMVGWYAFIAFTIAAFAQLVVGYLVDRHSIRAVFAVVALLQAVFFYFMIHLEGVAALLVAIAFMLAVFGQIPINDVLVGRIAKVRGAAELCASLHCDVLRLSDSGTNHRLDSLDLGFWYFILSPSSCRAYHFCSDVVLARA